MRAEWLHQTEANAWIFNILTKSVGE